MNNLQGLTVMHQIKRGAQGGMPGDDAPYCFSEEFLAQRHAQMEGANVVVHSRFRMQFAMEDHCRLKPGKRISSFSILGKQTPVFRRDQRKRSSFYFGGDF